MTPEIIREIVMGGAPGIEVEAALRHPDCPADVLEFILGQGKMDWASKLAWIHPNAREQVADEWHRKHRRFILPHPKDPLAGLTPHQIRQRRNIPQFPHDEAYESKSFQRYWDTKFRTDLLRFMLAIPPVERHSPFTGRKDWEYADLDTSYFAGNFFLPFGAHRAAERMAMENRMQMGLDDVVFQPAHLRKWKSDVPDPMTNIPEDKWPSFAVGLFWMLLLDRTVEQHHPGAYEKWRRMTMLPKFESMDAIGQMMARPMKDILTCIETRADTEEDRSHLHEELRDAVADSIAGMAEWMWHFVAENFDHSEIDADIFLGECGKQTRRYFRNPQPPKNK